MTARNSLVALAATVREVLAAPESLVPVSEEEKKAHSDLIDMVPELKVALVGDWQVLRDLAWSSTSLMPLHVINYYDIAKLVPLDEAISYDELSQKCGIPERMLERLLRMAMLSRLFAEHSEGKVSHSSTSKLLVQDVGIASYVDLMTETLWKAFAFMVDGLERWPGSCNPREGGYSTGMVCPDETSMYDDMQKHPVKRVGFGRVMELFSSAVGGASGFASAAISKAFPSLRLIVQDIGMNDSMKVDHANANIEWMAHDFFQAQTVVADLYLYRVVSHNYPDDVAVKILQAAIPALRPGAKILINDDCLPDMGEVRWFDEKYIRSLDMIMMASMNGRERRKDEWAALFKEADPRYKFLGATLPLGSRMVLIEA